MHLSSFLVHSENNPGHEAQGFCLGSRQENQSLGILAPTFALAPDFQASPRKKDSSEK